MQMKVHGSLTNLVIHHHQLFCKFIPCWGFAGKLQLFADAIILAKASIDVVHYPAV